MYKSDPLLVFHAGLINDPQHEGDVGHDVVAASEPRIVGERAFSRDESSLLFDRIDYIEYDCHLRVAPPHGVFCLLFPRSSISKYNLLLCNSVGVIDCGYRGNIIARFKYVIQPEDMISRELIRDDSGFPVEGRALINTKRIYQKGDRIAQLVFLPSFPVEMNQITDENMENLYPSKRGANGFGSTGQ